MAELYRISYIRMTQIGHTVLKLFVSTFKLEISIKADKKGNFEEEQSTQKRKRESAETFRRHAYSCMETRCSTYCSSKSAEPFSPCLIPRNKLKVKIKVNISNLQSVCVLKKTRKKQNRISTCCPF
jgi:hypothetical protein